MGRMGFFEFEMQRMFHVIRIINQTERQTERQREGIELSGMERRNMTTEDSGDHLCIYIYIIHIYMYGYTYIYMYGYITYIYNIRFVGLSETAGEPLRLQDHPAALRLQESPAAHPAAAPPAARLQGSLHVKSGNSIYCI